MPAISMLLQSNLKKFKLMRISVVVVVEMNE
jgi:hypothetical protein